MDTDFAEKHRLLGTRFINRVVNQVTTIDHYVREIEQGTETHLPELKQLIHQIAGTAATFGFSSISSHADLIQTELENLGTAHAELSADSLGGLLIKLNQAIREAAIQRSTNHS